MKSKGIEKQRNMMRKSIFALVAVLVFVAVVYYLIGKHEVMSRSAGTRSAYTNISSTELRSMLSKKDFFFVNVHVPYEGEIEKTDAFMPFNEIGKNLDKLPKDKNAKIVLYCRTGRMSKIAAETLASMGYVNVFNLAGGMIAWAENGYPLLKKR